MKNSNTASTLKILIISENSNFKNILAAKLRQDNFDIRLSNSGFHTLHLLEWHTDINMLIINGNMTDMSGYEIISIVRLISDKLHLPILYISTNKDGSEILSHIEAGANQSLIQSNNFQPIVENVHKLFKQNKKNVA